MCRIRYCIVGVALAIGAMSRGRVAFASEKAPVFQRTLTADITETAALSVDVSRGNVTIGYSRDDRFVIYAIGKDAGGKYLSEEFFGKNLAIEQKGNHVWIRDSAGTELLLGALYSIDYRIDVPYRTEVDSTVSGAGNQVIEGVYGPAKLVSGGGNIEARYVRFALIHASTGKGNITCDRDFEVDAETNDGNVTLMEDGNSKAVIKSGRGRIEIGGAQGTVDATTDAGPLHIKAVLKDDWQLKSTSGSIRVELPPRAQFEVEANTDSGGIDVNRADMEKPDAAIHHFHQQVNGGGKHIAARSVKGSISIE
jgi:hypothetical protein